MVKAWGQGIRTKAERTSNGHLENFQHVDEAIEKETEKKWLKWF